MRSSAFSVRYLLSFDGFYDETDYRLAVAWPALSNIWPILRKLNGKNNIAFVGALQKIIKARIALPKTAKHDFYSIAIDEQAPAEENLTRTEIWAEAVFFLPAGE